MTVSNTNNTMRYTGGGGTTLPYTFQIYAQTDLVVKKVLTSTGAETLLALTTDYTVTGVGVSGGGNVVLVSDPGATYTIVIQRSLALTQGTHYVPNDPFPATSHETALDRLTFISQQIQEQVDRCVKIGSANSGITLTLPKPTAGSSIGWSSDGLSLINITPDTSAAAASAAAAAASASTAAASQAAAAASAATINLPAITGNANKLLQVNSGGTGYQFISTIIDSLLSTITTAGKVAGSALASLSGIPSGAGIIPVANLPTGTSANNVVKLDGSAKLPAVDGSALTALAGSQVTAPLGAWVSKNFATIYQAATDGFVIGYGTAAVNPTNISVQFVTDSSATPSTVRMIQQIGSDSLGTDHMTWGFCSPVKKNDYYQATVSSDVSLSSVLFFISIGA